MSINSISIFLFTISLSLSSGMTIAAESPNFHSDYDKALQSSKTTGKPMVAIFSAKWCGPCQKMKKNVYPSSTVEPYHNSFVWAYLDADASKNKSLMKQFGVSGIPHISFVSPSGQVIGQSRGSVSPSSFAQTLSATLKKSGSPVVPQSAKPKPTSTEPKKKGLFGIFKKKQ